MRLACSKSRETRKSFRIRWGRPLSAAYPSGARASGDDAFRRDESTLRAIPLNVARATEICESTAVTVFGSGFPIFSRSFTRPFAPEP